MFHRYRLLYFCILKKYNPVLCCKILLGETLREYGRMIQNRENSKKIFPAVFAVFLLFLQFFCCFISSSSAQRFQADILEKVAENCCKHLCHNHGESDSFCHVSKESRKLPEKKNQQNKTLTASLPKWTGVRALTFKGSFTIPREYYPDQSTVFLRNKIFRC